MTAARPTRQWKAATSCGIEVMAMRRAMMAPTPPPIAKPEHDQREAAARIGVASASVVTMAMAMPIMP